MNDIAEFGPHHYLRHCYQCGGAVDNYGRCMDCDMGWPPHRIPKMIDITETYRNTLKKKEPPVSASGSSS